MIATVLPNIETHRTIVRLATRKDRDAVLSYYKENAERLAPYSPTWPEDFFTSRFWDLQIERNIEEFYTDVSARLFIFDRHAPSVTCLGNVSLGCILRNAAHFCFLGYGSAASYEGRGYMTEAVGAVVDYGFQQLNLHRIQANYMPSNERSGRLLKRLGFEIEGYARDYLCLNGVWQDHVMTAKLNPDWRSPAQV